MLTLPALHRSICFNTDYGAHVCMHSYSYSLTHKFMQPFHSDTHKLTVTHSSWHTEADTHWQWHTEADSDTQWSGHTVKRTHTDTVTHRSWLKSVTHSVQIRMHKSHIVVTGDNIAQGRQALLHTHDTCWVWQSITYVLQLLVCSGTGHQEPMLVTWSRHNNL